MKLNITILVLCALLSTAVAGIQSKHQKKVFQKKDADEATPVDDQTPPNGVDVEQEDSVKEKSDCSDLEKEVCEKVCCCKGQEESEVDDSENIEEVNGDIQGDATQDKRHAGKKHGGPLAQKKKHLAKKHARKHSKKSGNNKRDEGVKDLCGKLQCQCKDNVENNQPGKNGDDQTPQNTQGSDGGPQDENHGPDSSDSQTGDKKKRHAAKKHKDNNKKHH